MKIKSTSACDEQVLQLFSEYDEFMLNFLGEDKVYYTRYGEHEHLEKVWGVYVEDSFVGCVAYREKGPSVGEVKRLFIKEEFWGRGVSKELLGIVEDYARGQGCHTLFLDTRITLEPAVTIYRRAGFEIVFQQGLYIQMEKKL